MPPPKLSCHPAARLVGLCLAMLLACAAVAKAATITIQAGQPGAAVSSNLFGIFFEEINFGGDGGLYGEMVRNRTFEGSTSPEFWTLITTGTAAGQISVDSAVPLNTNTPRSLKLTKSSGTGSIGAANSGYWGLAIQSNATYDLSFYARSSNTFAGPLNARLESADGSQVYAQTSFNGLTTGWQKFTASLVSSATDTNARLALSITNAATVWLDIVSLFPQATFRNRANGMRADIANRLDDLRPSFLRYPGGNFIEGNTVSTAVRWKKTIGDLATRPGHTNNAWGYWSTDGFGLHEFLLLCEDLHCEPLYGIYAGLSLGYNGSTNNTVPLAEMGPYVQDALDLIEYCNGPTNSTWGAVRAANGHPAPFNLKYIEIGNENGGSYYNDRYALFYDAIKSNYPSMNVIACVWGGIPSSRPVEIQDEHYYSNPATFISYATKYDSYNRSGPKVFVGEYAVTSGYGTLGNLSAALGEAAFMTGIERNSDIVEMACYAPLFANVNGTQWRPDLINYDSYRVLGTPAYYVQQMFSRNRGDIILPITVSVPATVTNPPPRGAIGLGSWSTSVQYSNIVVTASNGATLYQSDFSANGTNGWRVFNGTWSASNGLYQQTALITDCRSTTGDTNWNNYTLSLKARKVTGSEGFLILFNWTDDNNWTWLNLGGWNNTQHGIEQNLNGSKSILGTRVSGSITAGQWYDISITLSNSHILAYLDGNLIQDVTYSTTSSAGLYASSLYNQSNSEVVVKAVNPYAQAVDTTFNLAGIGSVSPTATVIRLTSGSSADENTLAQPTKVYPTTNVIYNAGTNFTVSLPANSLSILRLHLPTPLPPANFKASASGWQVTLTWSSYSGATNYIIKRATTSGGPYTTIATTNAASFVDTGVVPGITYYYVLSAVLPAGETPATSEVSASVGAALWAYLPFDETNGTTAADVTGHGWDGTLVNSPAWVAGYSNNAVNLNGSSRYVALPAGAVSNLTDFSITAWVNLASVSQWMRIFDFGSGTTSYMFLTPQGGSGVIRYAITTNGNGAEQRINGTSILSTDGWHHVAVTLAGNLGTLYVDGVTVGSNTTMTLTPSNLGNSTQNWIGRSQWSADPYINGMVDDFRIYKGALSAGEVATFLTPLAAPTGLAANAGDGQVGLTWNAVANANAYNIKRSTTNGGPYTVVASNVVALAFTDSTTTNGTPYYYVVNAHNTVGESADSGQASATPLSALQSWQMGHFGCWDCPPAAPDADPDGDGMTNTNEFLTGTSPTNSASVFRVLSILPVGDDMRISWQSAGGRTNAVQVASGEYSNNFADVPGSLTVIAGSGDAVTNFTHAGAATNSPAQFYRIRLVP
jgi:alpha-L-arabinofuranosidase